jgi:hypothetical protein
MAITIDASVGGASANSYATEAEVIAYMAARLNATNWTTITGSTCTEDEKKALIEAGRELGAPTYIGARVTTTQALDWPRAWAMNPDSPVMAWSYYETTVIPRRVKNAQCELAFQFLKLGATDVAAPSPTAGILVKTIDVLSTTYSEYSQPLGLARFPRVLALLGPLLVGSGNDAAVVHG